MTDTETSDDRFDDGMHQFSTNMMHTESVLRDRSDDVLIKAWREYYRIQDMTTGQREQHQQAAGTYISSLVQLSHELSERANLEEWRRTGRIE